MSDDPDALASSLGVIWVAAGGVKVAIPESVAEIVRRLVQVADVWWCTTWGERANTHLAPAIGIEPLPVVGAGTRGVGIEWKVAQAGPLIDAATSHGRRIVWIEDFDGAYPELADVEFVDTAATGLISETDLPPGLLP